MKNAYVPGGWDCCPARHVRISPARRSRIARWLLGVCALVCLVPQPAAAQLPYARLDWLYPPGAQAGTELEVTVGGADLDFAQDLVFSHPGITGEPKRPAATEFDPHPEPVANTFLVKVSDDVSPGIYEARVVGRFGASTPRAFVVDVLPETSETSDNTRPETAMPVALNTIVNARANASGRDYFALDLAAGQRVLVDLLSHRIDSQMDATVAVWDDQGRLQRRIRDRRRRDPFVDIVADQAGKYILEVYDFTFQGGANHFYRLTVTDRPHIDFVYPPAVLAGTTERVTLYGRNLPGGTDTEWQLSDGTRLQKQEVLVAAPVMTDRDRPSQNAGFREPAELDVHRFLYHLDAPQGRSNRVAISLATERVVQEAEADNGRDEPAVQEISVPCEVVGQFFPARDEDWFQFSARKGDVFWIEVISERLALTTDPYLLVQRVTRDDQGNVTTQDLADADDAPQRPGGSGYNKATQDPLYRLEVPEDGEYRLLLRDVNGTAKGDPRDIYRLSIRRPWPTFELMVATQSPFNPDPNQPVRWNTLVRKGGATALTVAVVRKDGFQGPVTCNVSGLPAGLHCDPAHIGAGQTEGVLIIRADEDAADWYGPVQITGQGADGQRPIVRQARGATLAWDTPGKGARATPRLTGDILLMVAPERAPAVVELETPSALVTARGGKLSVPFKIVKHAEFKEKFAMAPLQVPAGVKAEVKLADDAVEGTWELTVEPGAQPITHSMALSGKSKLSHQRNPEAAAALEQRKAELTALVEQAKQAQQQRTEALQQAEAAGQQAEQVLQQAAATAADAVAQNQSADQQQAAQAAVAEAQAALEQAQAVLAQAQSDVQAGETRLNAANTALQQLEERAKQLAEQNKPADRTAYLVSSPVTLTIAEAPLELQLSALSTSVAQGASSDVRVTVDRRYGLADAVQLEVVLPDGLAGVTIPATPIAADANAATLTVTAAADAPPGTHRLTVRAKFKYNGHDMQVDRPWQLQVVAAE